MSTSEPLNESSMLPDEYEFVIMNIYLTILNCSHRGLEPGIEHIVYIPTWFFFWFHLWWWFWLHMGWWF